MFCDIICPLEELLGTAVLCVAEKVLFNGVYARVS